MACRETHTNNVKDVPDKEISKLKLSCLPEKLTTFIGRDKEVSIINSLLLEKDCGIVAIIGGPGFGKSTLAVEVSHRLDKQHDIPVIFSYLSNTSTIDEVALRLCLDIGVYPGDDPKSSLIFWLRNMEGKVVLVMDNIDQLLESETRSKFTDLVRTIRKNSSQRVQIITTSRTKFSITNLTIENIVLHEMEEGTSVELLKKSCPSEKVKDDYFHKLANLCGHVPLALCIAASRLQDVHDPNELLTWLTEKPMETLQTPEAGHHVRKTIKMSFEMLSDKDKRAFVRLSVMVGNFDRTAAEEIINRDGLETQDFLKNLVDRSLIERREKRFSIHLLVRRFLTDHDELQDERVLAQELMVAHFLKMCHSLTLKSYSKDGFIDARELLKKDAQNVEETLRVCQGRGTNLSPKVIESLVIRSDIYQSSSRFFYNFVRSVLLQTVTKGFLESCLELAKGRKEVMVEINFQCLLADQEGHKSAWKSSEYITKMEEIKAAFDKNEEMVKVDTTLLSHFYYSYGRYLFNKETTSSLPGDPFNEAVDYLKKSLNLRENKARSPLEKADEAITLIQLGRMNKRRSTREYATDKGMSERYASCAANHFKRALELAKEYLGDHELTSTCYKVLGDLFLTLRKQEEAMTYYEDTKNMHKKLGLDSGESMVYLLKNYASCFSYLRRFAEAMKQLYQARDMADKLPEPHTPCRALLYVTLAQVVNAWKRGSHEATEYANVAMEMKEFLNEFTIDKMQRIINGGVKTWR